MYIRTRWKTQVTPNARKTFVFFWIPVTAINFLTCLPLQVSTIAYLFLSILLTYITWFWTILNNTRSSASFETILLAEKGALFCFFPFLKLELSLQLLCVGNGVLTVLAGVGAGEKEVGVGAGAKEVGVGAGVSSTTILQRSRSNLLPWEPHPLPSRPHPPLLHVWELGLYVDVAPFAPAPGKTPFLEMSFIDVTSLTSRLYIPGAFDCNSAASFTSHSTSLSLESMQQ